MEDKSFGDALRELADRFLQEMVDEAMERMHRVNGNTVASAVEDMPEGARKEAMREILFVGKVLLLIQSMKSLGFYTQDEVDELKDHLLEWNKAINRKP